MLRIASSSSVSKHNSMKFVARAEFLLLVFSSTLGCFTVSSSKWVVTSVKGELTWCHISRALTMKLIFSPELDRWPAKIESEIGKQYNGAKVNSIWNKPTKTAWSFGECSLLCSWWVQRVVQVQVWLKALFVQRLFSVMSTQAVCYTSRVWRCTGARYVRVFWFLFSTHFKRNVLG